MRTFFETLTEPQRVAILFAIAFLALAIGAHIEYLQTL